MWEQGQIHSFWRDTILRARAHSRVHWHESCRYQMYSHIYCVPAWPDRWLEIALCPSSPAGSQQQLFATHSSKAEAMKTTFHGFMGYIWWLRFVLRNPPFNLEIFKNRIIFPFFSFILEVRTTRHMTKLREDYNRFSSLTKEILHRSFICIEYKISRYIVKIVNPFIYFF